MPIYEYACQKCNAHIEVMQKISDKPLTRHVKCGGMLEKQWSQTSFQLKGAGWYVTDYANKKSDAKENADGSKSEAKETKTDAAVKADSAASADGAKKKTTATKTSSAPSGGSGGGD